MKGNHKKQIWRWTKGLTRGLTLGGAVAVAATVNMSCSKSSDSGSGSSSSGSSVTFSLPSSVDVLKVSATSGQSVTAMAYDDAGTDYSKQPQGLRVSHPVGESLSTVSSIMCFLGQLGVGTMWSEAALPRTYLVGIDKKKCDSNGGGGPSQGAASGGGGGSTAATELTMVAVRLSREAAGSYPRAEIWFTESEGGGEHEIRASVDVIQAPDTATAPYGTFNLYWSMYSSGTRLGGGNLLVGNNASTPILYRFYESMTHNSQTEMKAASVEMQADGTHMKAAVQYDSPWNGSGAWLVATTTDSVLANNKTIANAAATTVDQINVNGGQCMSLQNFNYRVFGYGLYNEADGSKKTLNTGVNCEYTDSSSNKKHCNIGRFGAWFEPETGGTQHTFVNGDTVTRREWGSNAAHDGETLTMFVSSGKLTKYTVKQYTLAEIRGIEMRYWDNGAGKEYIVVYKTAAGDGVGSDGFYKTDEMSWGGSGPTKTDITDAQITINSGDWMFFWSDSLGGVNFIGGQSNVTARLEQMVVPGSTDFTSGNLDLHCLARCPKTGISQANLTTWGGPYQTDPANVGAAIDYTMSNTDMVLHAGTHSAVGAAVALNTGVTFDGTGSQFNWGLESGALVTSTAGMTNLWDIYTTPGATYFQYRMGPNSWDKLVLVKDGSNNFLTFDEPLAFDYTHLTANDRNGSSKYNNKKFLVRYFGEGHIEGFPWTPVDRDGDGTPDMWFPEVSLKDGVQLTANSQNYRVKAMFGDLTLTTTGANCSSLTLAVPAQSVPSAVEGTSSNGSTSRPSTGTCVYSRETDAAVGCN